MCLTVESVKKIIEAYEYTSLDLLEWDNVLNNSLDVSIYHVKSMVDFYVAYFEGYNISFVLHDKKQVVAIFPLFIHKNNNGWNISVEGAHLIKPLFIYGVSKKIKKKLEEGVVEIIYRLSRELNINKVRVFELNNTLSNWYLLWLERADDNFLSYHLGIDLTQTIDDIRVNFRRRYKSLVNKALREWEMNIFHDKVVTEIFEEFRLLHLSVAGRETRNRDSWEIQRQQIQAGEGVLITARDNGVLIGAGFFNYSKSMGMYSVGAYKRELFDKPIAHGVQLKAIEFLKQKGCEKYYIGQKMTLLDRNKPTEKELSISHFKEGFAGYIYVQPHLEILINE